MQTRYGRWTVLEQGSGPLRTRKSLVECDCDAGTIRLVSARALEYGKSKSCGCLRKEMMTEMRTGEFGEAARGYKHGACNGGEKSQEYVAWWNLKQRIGNKNHPRYPLYGGSGASMSEAWMDFATFERDMGPQPPDRPCLLRLDGDEFRGGNVVWVSRRELFLAYDKTLKRLQAQIGAKTSSR